MSLYDPRAHSVIVPPDRRENLFGSGVFGLTVFITPDIPKMRLSDELIPGEVRWPPGFKEEMDAWMLKFFGTVNATPDGEVRCAGSRLYMNPRTYQDFKASLDKVSK